MIPAIGKAVGSAIDDPHDAGAVQGQARPRRNRSGQTFGQGLQISGKILDVYGAQTALPAFPPGKSQHTEGGIAPQRQTRPRLQQRLGGKPVHDAQRQAVKRLDPARVGGQGRGHNKGRA